MLFYGYKLYLEVVGINKKKNMYVNTHEKILKYAKNKNLVYKQNKLFILKKNIHDVVYK